MNSRRLHSSPRRAARHSPPWPPVVVLVLGGGGGAPPPWLRDLLARFGGGAKPGVRPGRKFAAARPAARRPPPLAPGAQRKFADFPISARAHAERRKRVLASYFAELAAGGTVSEAIREARRRSVTECRTPKSAKTISRWVKRVAAAGGMDRAPMEAFLDAKSSPHPRARKAGKPKT